jgi:hypothetical protein
MVARIYRPARTAMSSGLAKTRHWVLEYEPERPRSIEPLMGYTSSDDMRSQVQLRFDTKAEAIAYAERNGIPFQLSEPRERTRAALSYSDNFHPNRPQPWTH